MKKLLFILCLFVGFIAGAQTSVTSVSTDGSIVGPDYVYIWGSTADTLTNADTLNYVLRIKGNDVQDFNIKLYSDFVSGTAGGTLTSYSSIDGVNYVPVDTITVTSLTADAMDAETMNLDNYLYPYVKFIYLQSGTAVTIPKVYVYTKRN
jgi:hypothetical protein